ncbi:CvpA family protein [Desulfopila sp. IMCC35008]|uniref:CvpA family protein n=1 Tax=Desulfopila sp. IMCC35008 TaxID=2653858 RepID=UPI0013D1EC55|nr:CvpA family protein [Desulfopila sp. IMCC35008]
MNVGVDVTTYDVVVFAIFALLIGRGLWLGFLKQITGLAALYLGYIAASQYHETLFPFLKDLSENPKVIFMASCVILFFVTYIVVMLLGKLLAYVIQITITSWFDRVLGGILGVAKGVILVLLMHMVLGTILAPENQMLRNCMSCDYLNEGTGLARELIKSEDVRKALQQQQPAISAVKEYLKTTEQAEGEEPKADAK